MLFDTNNQFYLLPDEYVMPIYIPVLYFECHPEFAGTTTLFFPSKNKNQCKTVLSWDNAGSNLESQQYNSDLINFFAIKSDSSDPGMTFTYTYPQTYGDTENTLRPRRDKSIYVDGDVIYEINFSKLIDLIHNQTGVTISDNNIRVNLTRIYGNYYNGQNLSTN